MSLVNPATKTNKWVVELSSLEIRMSRSENLPVLPQAVSTMLRLSDDPNVSQRDLEKAFEKDPAITAKILKVANSAYYGGTNVPTIGRAITFLGITAIRSLVIGVAFQQASSNTSQSKHFDKLAYWRHSLATAIACRIVGKLKCPARSEELYCMGMLHDIGALVMERFLPKELDLVLDVVTKRGIPILKAEKQILGYDHTEVGALLAKKWGLSEPMTAGISYQNCLAPKHPYNEQARMIAAAHALVFEAGFGHANESVDPEERACLESLDIHAEQLPVIAQVIHAEVEKACDSFNIAA